MEIRVLREEDKQQCADLWRMCFTDSESFVKWFFDRRYCPAYSACVEEDGLIVCALHGYPFTIRLRNFTVPGAIIAGVATHPDHRGKGLMKKLMAFEMQNLRALGCAAVTHTPVEIPVYRSCGHLPCSDSLYFDLTEKLPFSSQPVICNAVSEAVLQKLLDCYQTFAQRYSAILARTLENMALKADDYFSDAMQCAYLESDAYAFYKETEDNTVYIDELVYRSEEAALALLAGMQAAYPGKMLQGKLPSDFTGTTYFSKTEVAPQTVMGLVNPDRFLPYLPPALPRILLEDPLVPQNNMLLAGPSCTENTVSLPAGVFLQLMAGYPGAEKSSAVSLLEKALPPKSCYIIDAY